MPTCLPWWHKRFARYSTGSSRPRILSGCSVVAGNVNCSPESMRANAERQLQARGWRGDLSLAAYTLARYTSSEVGSGTPEEKVAVAEAAVNHSEGDVVSLLLYRQAAGHPNRGWYGPIHGPSGVGTAPYGRWAATSKDPGVDDLLIARFVLSGLSENFAQGATSQYGMEYISDPEALVRKLAARGDYWVGPLPGVDHWHTWLYADRGIPVESTMGQALLQRGLTSLDMPRPDWSGLRTCGRIPGVVVGGLAIAAGLGLAYAVATHFYPIWQDRLS